MAGKSRILFSILICFCFVLFTSLVSSYPVEDGELCNKSSNHFTLRDLNSSLLIALLSLQCLEHPRRHAEIFGLNRRNSKIVDLRKASISVSEFCCFLTLSEFLFQISRNASCLQDDLFSENSFEERERRDFDARGGGVYDQIMGREMDIINNIQR